MRRLPLVLIGALLGAFALSVLGVSRAPVSDSAAFDAWLIRDLMPVRAAAPQDVARAVLSNWRASLDRMRGAGGVRLDLLLLKGWTTIFGSAQISIAAARGLAVAFVTAVVYRLLLRRVRAGGAITGAAALVVVAVAGAPLAAPAGYQPALDVLAHQRALTEPVVTIFRPDSPLGYHHAQASLRPGIGIDLGWRAFSPDELNPVLDGLGSEIVWVLADTGLSTTLGHVHDILSSKGRTRDLCLRPTPRVVLARYVAGGDADACA